MVLNIHTTTEKAIINLCDDEKIIGSLYNDDRKQHAAFLHQAIHELLEKHAVSLSQLKAVGVTHGPGSYTGIRVGLATAKGLCYSLQIPLITFNTLELLACSTIQQLPNSNDTDLFCPMIDARRMEVFTAIYNYQLEEIMQPQSMVLNEESFSDFSNSHPIYFSGNGSNKFKELHIQSNNNFYIDAEITTESIFEICRKKMIYKKYSDLIHSEAFYLKEVHFMQKKS